MISGNYWILFWKFSHFFCRQFSFADALKQQPTASAESPGATAAPTAAATAARTAAPTAAPTAAATAARIAKIRRARADQTAPPSANEKSPPPPANEKLPPPPANKKPALLTVHEKPPQSAAAPAVHRVKKERAKLEQLGPSPVRRSGLNKISAATFAHIGRSGEEEKYVMGSGGEDSNASRQEVVLFKYITKCTGTKWFCTSTVRNVPVPERYLGYRQTSVVRYPFCGKQSLTRKYTLAAFPQIGGGVFKFGFYVMMKSSLQFELCIGHKNTVIRRYRS
jgi:hypothetical protein